MVTRNTVRKRIQGLLKTLRDGGVKLLFEQGDLDVSGDIRVALRGVDLYIAPLSQKQTGLYPHYQRACRKKDGSEITVNSPRNTKVVTLDTGFTYHVYTDYPEKIPQDIFPLLERGHEFYADYMMKLNSGC